VDVLYCPGSTDWPEYRQPRWRAPRSKASVRPVVPARPHKGRV